MSKLSFFKGPFFRVSMAILIVFAISASLWFSVPQAKAVDVDVYAPVSAVKGNSYSFTVTVNIQDMDKLPLQQVDIKIYNVSSPSTTTTFGNIPMPITSGATNTSTYSGSGGTATIRATTAAGWGYETGISRTGYGYGYQSYTWGYATGLSTGYGYGYSYGGSYMGTTSVTFAVNWIPPTSWDNGTYAIEPKVFANGGDESKAFTVETPATFTLGTATASVGTGGGTTTTTTTTAGTTDVSSNVDTNGRFTNQVKAQSQDKNVEVVIAQNTIGKIDGNPISEITITPMDSPPTQTNKGTIGLAYDLGPDGATFDPAITLTFTYDPKDIPAGVEEENLTLAVWNGTEWVELTNVHVDPETNTISGETTHFTEFAIIANTAPADIVGSGLSITPSEINAGEAVKISFTVTNEGDIAGQEDIALLLNGVETANQSVTLLGGESQELTFSTTRATGGTYSVEVAGLKGSFTVKGAAPAASPTPTVEPTSPAPTTPAATTPAATTPAQTPPEPEPMNVMMIVLIAIAAVIVVGLLVWYAMKSMR